MKIVIRKSERTLALIYGGVCVFTCRVALGAEPEGAKRTQGDGRTPEGDYFICLVKDPGKFGRSLGLSYPNPADAALALEEGRIDQRTFDNIQAAHAERRRPPWGSPLGGEIYIHEGGSGSDWTQGCIALDASDMDTIFLHWPEVTKVQILP